MYNHTPYSVSIIRRVIMRNFIRTRCGRRNGIEPLQHFRFTRLTKGMRKFMNNSWYSLAEDTFDQCRVRSNSAKYSCKFICQY